MQPHRLIFIYPQVLSLSSNATMSRSYPRSCDTSYDQSAASSAAPAYLLNISVLLSLVYKLFRSVSMFPISQTSFVNLLPIPKSSIVLIQYLCSLINLKSIELSKLSRGPDKYCGQPESVLGMDSTHVSLAEAQ